MDASNAGRDLAAQRRRTAHICERCHKEFLGIATARICSPACRKALYRARVRGRQALAELPPPFPAQEPRS